MKRVLIAIGIISQLVMSQTSHAITFEDTVTYWPTWQSSDLSDNLRDVKGHPNITGGTATIEADRTLRQITFSQDANYPSWSGLWAMDLFINVLDHTTDNNWDYVVRGGQTAGNYALFDIRGVHLSSIKGGRSLDSYLITSPDIPDIRNDHPTAISQGLLNTRYAGNPFGITQLGTVQFAGLTDALTTSYDFNNGSFQVGDVGFILGWGVNCANDVIYEQVPVPEPGTMMLVGFGLLGLAVYGKRRMNKSA